jgi:hypothetical protein
MDITLINYRHSWATIFRVNWKSNFLWVIKIALLNIALLIFNQTLTSQQLPIFSQYTFNAFLLNPAVAGAEGYTAINLTSRALDRHGKYSVQDESRWP